MRNIAIIWAGTVLLAGCAAVPKVGYSVIRGPGDLNEKQIGSYALQESIVNIRATTSGEGNKKKTDVTAVYSRQDHEGLRIALLRRGSLGVETGITIKRFDNTDIPSEVTVKVKDSRLDLIKKAGEVVVAVIKSGLVPIGGLRADLPARLNLSALILKADPNTGLVTDTDSNIKVRYGPLPPDAIPVGDLAQANSTSYFYYAACRTAVVSLSYGEGNEADRDYEFVFKVSDPRYLQRVRMPVDGKITMHDQCGASVTGEMAGDDASSGLAIVAALIAQGKSIEDALKAGGKEE